MTNEKRKGNNGSEVPCVDGGRGESLEREMLTVKTRVHEGSGNEKEVNSHKTRWSRV